jgi:hypothetical protein
MERVGESPRRRHGIEVRLYNCPKEARERLQKLFSQRNVKNVLILMMLVVPTLQRFSQLPYLNYTPQPQRHSPK